MKSNIDHSAEAKKIAKILSDGRMTQYDYDLIAMMLVMWIRNPEVMEKVEFMFDRFRYHRYSIEFGEGTVLTRDDVIAMMEA